MVCRNYAKQQVGLFARIISKVSAMTVLQYINFINMAYRSIGNLHFGPKCKKMKKVAKEVIDFVSLLTIYRGEWKLKGESQR